MNPTTGTFISMDTYQGSIFDPTSLHKYLYANANPVMYCDPSGYMSIARVQYDINCITIARKLIATLLASVAVYESKVLSNLIVDICNSISKGLNWGLVNITFATEAIIRILANEFEDAIEDLKRKIPDCTIIYRKGSGSYKNLTPRPDKDTEGLSYQLVPPLDFPFTFTAKELVDSTGILQATKDGPNHVSVYPRNMITMQQWMNSRDTADVNPHKYSVLLRSISVRVG